MAPDTDIAAIISGAEVNDDGEVVLSSAKGGKDTFEITDVRLDYAGVKEQVTVSFSDLTDADFFDGGGVAMSFAWNDGEDKTLDLLVDMAKDGADFSKSETLQDMLESVQGAMMGPRSEWRINTGAVMTGRERIQADNREAFSFTIAGEEYAWEEVGTNNYLTPVSSSVNYNDFGQLGDGTEDTVGAVVRLDDLLPFIRSFEEVESAAVVDGLIRLTYSNDYQREIDLGNQNPASIVLKMLDTSVLNHLYKPVGSLLGVVESVSLENDVFTLTAADVGRGSFSVSKAAADNEAVLEEATFALSTANSDYYTGGKVSVTIDGEKFTVDMVESSTNGSSQTLTALKNAIQQKIDDNTLSDVGSVTLNGGKFTLKAASAEDDQQITISELTFDVAAVKQVTEIDLSDLKDSDFFVTDSKNNSGQVSVSIAGKIVTANMADTKAGTLTNLKNAIVLARDGDEDTNVDAVTQISDALGEVSLSGDVLKLTAKDAVQTR